MDKAVLVQGLAFGDCGKGGIVDFLTNHHHAKLVVRFNGGAQAAHHVVLPDGRSHCFAQWGSGTFAGARTHFSRFTLIDPQTMVPEAEHLKELGVCDPYGLLTVDPRALVVTPLHRQLNRLREKCRGADRHGSCGMGIGEAVAFSLNHPDMALRAADLYGPSYRTKMDALTQYASQESQGWDLELDYHADGISQWRHLPRLADDEDALASTEGTVIFEGAQGVLLDERHGFHPYTTWSNCTFENALELAGNVDTTKVGVIRAYGTRHGAGPFPGEDVSLRDQLRGHEHNGEGEWQGAFRVGHFDRLLFDYALTVAGGVDTLAVTSLDRLRSFRAVVAYDHTAQEPAEWEALFGKSGAFRTWLPCGWGFDGVARQGRLTKAISLARPVLSRPMEAIELLEIMNGPKSPVGLISLGPKRAHKRHLTVHEVQELAS